MNMTTKPKFAVILCEHSQEVTIALRKRGVLAFSNDTLACTGPKPEFHLRMDAFEALKFRKWDLIIMHPPCTAVAVSGNRTYAFGKPSFEKRLLSAKWTKKLWDQAVSACDYVGMENPVGVLNSLEDFPKPQYIQPWQFGHGETKKTGLWLHGLQPLKETNVVPGREQRIWKMGPSEDRGHLRSLTYPGIAEAMAEQWTNQLNTL